MASSERVRIEVAFDGGQIMGAVVAASSADALEKALGSADVRAGAGEAALSLDAEDGRYTIALQRVVYVKRFARDSRVGFGSRPDASGVGRTLVGVIHLQGTVAWITTQQSMS